MLHERPLWRLLLRFYGRLLGLGLAAAAVVAGGWSLVLLVRGRPVTYVNLSDALFWAGVAALGWVAVSLHPSNRMMGHAEGLWYRSPISHRTLLQDQEHRLAFAWYAGTVGLTCIATAVLVPYLFA